MSLTGLISAPFTPMHSDGSINLAPIGPMAEHLIANRVHGAFVCGSTGEGVGLTNDERMQVAKRWVEVAGKKMAIMIHVGHLSLPDAQALAKHAQSIGAHSISAVAPCFFKPANVKELVNYCSLVAQAAPALPFYYYHIPARSGVNLPMKDFIEQAVAHIPNFGGMKYTYENLMEFRQCLVMAEGKYDILFGRDEMLLAGLAMGATGAVGTCYNFAAPIFNSVIDCFHQGDIAEAQKHQTMGINLIDALIRHGGLPAFKSIMKFIGFDCGDFRAPMTALTAQQERLLRQELEAIGYFEAIK